MKVKLGELTKIRTGKLDANAASKDGTYPFFTCSKEPLRISTYSYDCECVLVAGNGDLNAKYYNGKFDAYQRTYIIESNGDGRLHLPYLYHFMTRYIQELRKLSIGGVIKYIKLGNLTDAEISLPSIKEQKDACEKLKKVKNIIDKKEAQIYYLDNIIKARFVEMFGNLEDNAFNYPVKTIQEVCEQIKDGTHQTPTYTDDRQSGYIFLSSKDVTSGKVDWCHPKYIPEDLHRELYARVSPKKGDILLAKNGTTGVAAIVDKEIVFDIYVSLALLRPHDVNEVYLWAAINSDGTKKQFNSSLKGIGVSNLHLGEIRKTRIIIPPIDLQNQFATFVTQIDKSKFVLSNELTMCDFYIRLIHDRVMHSRINLRVAQ